MARQRRRSQRSAQGDATCAGSRTLGVNSRSPAPCLGIIGPPHSGRATAQPLEGLCGPAALRPYPAEAGRRPVALRPPLSRGLPFSAFGSVCTIGAARRKLCRPAVLASLERVAGHHLSGAAAIAGKTVLLSYPPAASGGSRNDRPEEAVCCGKC